MTPTLLCYGMGSRFCQMEDDVFARNEDVEACIPAESFPAGNSINEAQDTVSTHTSSKVQRWIDDSDRHASVWEQTRHRSIEFAMTTRKRRTNDANRLMLPPWIFHFDISPGMGMAYETAGASWENDMGELTN